MELIIAWLVFPIAAGSVAKGKKRNVYLFAALGLLIGPFAILVAALVEPGPGADEGYN